MLNLIAINYNPKTSPQQNISNSYSRNVFSFNSNQTAHHSNLTSDYSIIVKQQIYLKVKSNYYLLFLFCCNIFVDHLLTYSINIQIIF